MHWTPFVAQCFGLAFPQAAEKHPPSVHVCFSLRGTVPHPLVLLCSLVPVDPAAVSNEWGIEDGEPYGDIRESVLP